MAGIWLGCSDEPSDENGSEAVGYSGVMNDPLSGGDGEVTVIELYEYATGNIYINILTDNGSNSFTDDVNIGALTVGEGLNQYYAPGDFTAESITNGQYMGWASPSPGGAMIERDQSNGEGHWYLAGTDIDGTPDTYSDARSLEREQQLRVWVEYAGAGGIPQISMNYHLRGVR